MYVKISDDFPSHPKVLMAGPAAGFLFICGLCYANKYLTDGYIPAGALVTLAPGLRKLEQAANRLVDVGLWERAEIGWQVHDYAEWQRTAEQILAGRRADSERKRKRNPTGIRPESDGIPRAGAREQPRAPSREVEVEVKKGPPVVPPRGGRQRDRARWEKDVEAFAEEHYPHLERAARVRAVRQAFRYGHAETPQEVTEFIREHFPDLQEQLEP